VVDRSWREDAPSWVLRGARTCRNAKRPIVRRTESGACCYRFRRRINLSQPNPVVIVLYTSRTRVIIMDCLRCARTDVVSYRLLRSCNAGAYRSAVSNHRHQGGGGGGGVSESCATTMARGDTNTCVLFVRETEVPVNLIIGPYTYQSTARLRHSP